MESRLERQERQLGAASAHTQRTKGRLERKQEHVQRLGAELAQSGAASSSFGLVAVRYDAAEAAAARAGALVRARRLGHAAVVARVEDGEIADRLVGPARTARGR